MRRFYRYLRSTQRQPIRAASIRKAVTTTARRVVIIAIVAVVQAGRKRRLGVRLLMAKAVAEAPIRIAPPLGPQALHPFVAVSRVMDRIWIATMTGLAASERGSYVGIVGANPDLYTNAIEPNVRWRRDC